MNEAESSSYSLTIDFSIPYIIGMEIGSDNNFLRTDQLQHAMLILKHERLMLTPSLKIAEHELLINL